jgi:hypothetical protein
MYKGVLNLETVLERHQDKIMVLANAIDNDVFEDSSFNALFLFRPGDSGAKVPKLNRYLYAIFLCQVQFGEPLPLFFLLFGLPIRMLIFSSSLVAGIIFYISISRYRFLNNEMVVNFVILTKK